MTLSDRWSCREWRRIYWRTYKAKKRGEIPDHVNLVQLVDKLFNEEHPTDDKPLHPDLQPLKTDPETGSKFANPDRSVALYLKQLAKDEADNYVTVNFDVPDGQESNPLIHHPRVHCKRLRKKVTELPSSNDW